MRKFILLLIVLLSVQTASAQSILRKQKKDGKWGFVDTSGNLIIDYQYQNVYDFYQNVTLVKKSNLWGFINNKGETIVPLELSESQKYANSGVIRAKKEA